MVGDRDEHVRRFHVLVYDVVRMQVLDRLDELAKVLVALEQRHAVQLVGLDQVIHRADAVVHERVHLKVALCGAWTGRFECVFRTTRKESLRSVQQSFWRGVMQRR